MPRLPSRLENAPLLPRQSEWEIKDGYGEYVFSLHTQQWPGKRLWARAIGDHYRALRVLCGLIATILFAALVLGAAVRRQQQPDVEPLRFTAEGTFQITIFEDLHFGENAWDQWGPQQDISTVAVMNTILDAESPQLVVLNGDLITGENTYAFNSTEYIDQIVSPLVQRNIPWASTYGNHDSSFNLSRELILAREQRYSNARTQKMVSSRGAGVSNYYLQVYPSSGQSTVPALILWFFDSRGGFLYQQTDPSGDPISQPNWVDQSVVDWFISTDADFTEQHGVTIPSLAFVHIPTNVSLALQTQLGVDPNLEPGVNDDIPLAQQGQGWCEDGSNGDSCSYGGQDVPFIQALASTPGLMALFSAHDHGDTWCYKWNSTLPGLAVAGNGLNLCFGQHTGYGGYGTWIRGSRQVLVSEAMLRNDAGLQTWIRLEDQSVVGAVTLNDTYGQDVYPATPNRHTSCPTCNYEIISPMPEL